MRVSVVIPVFNAAPYLEQAVRSALSQSQTSEVLLVEDGSTDGSAALCEELARRDKRVRVLHHKGRENRGAAASRNLGIVMSSADFIAFLDADDFMLPGRFDAAQRRLETDHSIDGVYEAVGTYFENDTARDWWERNRSGIALTTVKADLPPDQLFTGLLSDAGRFCTDGIVVRKKLFNRTGMFDCHLYMAEDTLMWRKMALHGRLVGESLDRAVAMRRVHGDNSIIRLNQDNSRQSREGLRCLLRWCRWRKVNDADRHAVVTKLVLQTEPPGSSYHLPPVARFMRSMALLMLTFDDPRVWFNVRYRHALGDATGFFSLVQRLGITRPVHADDAPRGERPSSDRGTEQP